MSYVLNGCVVKSDELYLTDEHQVARIVEFVIAHVDEAFQLLQVQVAIAWNAQLRDTRRCHCTAAKLPDAVISIAGTDADESRRRTTLADVFRHELEHKAVSPAEGAIGLDGEVEAVLHRRRNQHEVARPCPDIGSITICAVLRIVADIAHGSSYSLCLFGNTCIDAAIDVLQTIQMRVIVHQRRVKLCLTDLMLLQHRMEIGIALQLPLIAILVFCQGISQVVVIEQFFHVVGLDVF